jgi:hypothetical protein
MLVLDLQYPAVILAHFACFIYGQHRQIGRPVQDEEESELAPAAGCPAWCFALALRDDQAVESWGPD